ncbi:MAG: hypothetical protein NVS2B4_13900 [Ramlibacter sp.]
MLEANDRQQAQAIMRELGETERKVLPQLYRAIDVLGSEVVQAVLAEARETEAGGGLLRKDGERRTLGGVFFALLKTHTTREQYKRIFWPAPHKPLTPPPPVLATVTIRRLLSGYSLPETWTFRTLRATRGQGLSYAYYYLEGEWTTKRSRSLPGCRHG